MEDTCWFVFLYFCKYLHILISDTKRCHPWESCALVSRWQSVKGVGHTFTFSGCTCKNEEKKPANEDENGHMLLNLGQMLLWMGSSSGKNHFFFTGYHAFANVSSADILEAPNLLSNSWAMVKFWDLSGLAWMVLLGDKCPEYGDILMIKPPPRCPLRPIGWAQARTSQPVCYPMATA